MIWKPPAKKTSFKSLKESGNMILAIFGAVALVGTIGAGTSLIVNGPMKVMSQVNRTAQTESQMMVASKMVMLDVANLSSSGDCDGDSLSEPREWRDAAGLGPDGVADSDGGGFIPMQIGTSKRDSWGTQYGYCVWDHGALIDENTCGGVGQRRLQGFNSIDHPAIAVISAGPNGTFETPCRDFDNADNDSNDVLDYSAGDDPLISPTGDDIVSIYSYAEAAEDNLGIWELAVDPTTNEAVARTNKDVEFTGSSTSFGGTLTLDGTEGLDIPDDASLIICDATVEGQIRRNMSNDPPTLEVCEDTGGSVYAWAAMATSTPVTPSDIAAAIADPVFDPNHANCTKNKGGPLEEVGDFDTSGRSMKIWTDEKYIYVADYTNISVYSFDGTTFEFLDSEATPHRALDIWGDGTYIYLATQTVGLRAYSFDGAILSLIDSSASLSASIGVWGDGTYIYVADHSHVTAHSFDGSTFTALGNFNTPDIATSVWGDGTYIYVADGASGVRAYSFDGSTFTEEGFFDTPDIATSVWGDGTYIYVADGASGVRAYSFDGSTFTEEGFFDTPDIATSVWGDGTYIYVADGASGVRVYDFTGSSFIEKDVLDTPDSATGVWGDGTYIYVADYYSGMRAYSGYTCTEAYVPDIKENHISQITVEQTGETDDTLGSAGWAQVLASDDNGDETGIAFVIDQNASKGSAPTAAITAIREADPGAAGLAFKTKSSDGTINNRNYLGHNGYLGLDVTAGTTANIFTTLQIGDHSTTWNNPDYQKGLLVTSNDGSDQIGYFGFYDDTTDTNTIMFSKTLKIKGTNTTGSSLNEYVRFEQTQATTFFGNVEVKGEAQTTSIQNKSYSNTDINDGELDFKRKRLDSAGADAIVQDGDTIGQIKFQGFDGTSMNEDGPTIIAKVDGIPAAGTIPTSLSFKTKQTNFDPAAANCGANNGGPFVEVDRHSPLTDADGVWGDGNYIYTADGSGIQAFSFDGATLTLIDSLSVTGSTEDLWGDGTYIYAVSAALKAFSFDGTTLTEVATLALPDPSANDVWVDGQYIYATNSTTGGIRAYTFDGATFTELAFLDTPGGAIQTWGDGTYMYLADSSAGGVRAYTFDGSAFTEVASFDTPGTTRDVWGDGNYIYVADSGNGIIAFTFDGSSFVELDTFDTPHSAITVWGDGTHIYVADTDSGIRAYTFDGTTFIEIDAFDTPGQAGGLWGDGTYIYVADSASGLAVYSGFECNSEIKVAGNDNVGFQKSDPESKLHVGGRILADEGILIGNDTTCAAADEGTMRYVSGLDEPIEVCDGSSWIKLSAAIATPEPSLDCAPIPFELRDITDGTASTEYTSNGFIVGGLDTGEECYLSLSSDDSNAKINLNGADETSNIVTVENGDVVKLKATTGTGDECKTCHLALGIQQASFQVGTGLGCKNGYPFDPEYANCRVNNNVAFSTVDTISATRHWASWGDGTHIYVANDTALKAYIFDGVALSEVGSYALTDDARKIWGDGEYIYIANDAVGVQALTFDGATFTHLDTYNTPDLAWGMWSDGTYIYIGDYNGDTLYALSFNGTSFTLAGSYSTPERARGVWGDGQYIYIAVDADGVQALKFNGVNFTLLDTYNTSGTAYNIWGDDDYIYIADDTSGIHALTFNGASFTFIDTYNTAGNAKNISGDGNYLYVSDRASGIVVLSFNGTTFSLIDTYGSIGDTIEIWTDGTYHYTSENDGGFRVLSGFECTYADPPTPPSTPFDPEAANCTINDGGPFVEVDNFDTTGDAYGVWGDGTYVYVADGTSGLHAFSFDGSSFTLEDTDATPGDARGVWGDGAYIYVADFGGGGSVHAYSFDGTTLTLEDTDTTPGNGYNVWGDGTYVYVAGASTGVHGYTFDGTSFTLEGSLNTAGTARDVWGDGTYIYVADNSPGLRAYSFDGSTFTEEDVLDITDSNVGVWGDNTYIYTADLGGGVHAHTFDGTTLTEVGSFDTAGESTNVWSDGSSVYVADKTSGVHSFSFNGTTFTLEDTENTTGEALGVWGDGTFIYVADEANGVTAYSGFECTSTD